MAEANAPKTNTMFPVLGLHFLTTPPWSTKTSQQVLWKKSPRFLSAIVCRPRCGELPVSDTDSGRAWKGRSLRLLRFLWWRGPSCPTNPDSKAGGRKWMCETCTCKGPRRPFHCGLLDLSRSFRHPAFESIPQQRCRSYRRPVLFLWRRSGF